MTKTKELVEKIPDYEFTAYQFDGSIDSFKDIVETFHDTPGLLNFRYDLRGGKYSGPVLTVEQRTVGTRTILASPSDWIWIDRRGELVAGGLDPVEQEELTAD